MDDIKPGVSEFDAWHFKNSPMFAPDYTGSHQGKDPAAQNIVWALQTSISTLRDATRSPLDQAFALRMVIHLIGDLHQPLHNSDRFSAAHPGGDLGGNLVFVIDPITRNRMSLHAFWDSAAGVFADSPYCCYPNFDRNREFDDYLASKIPQIKNASCPQQPQQPYDGRDIEEWHNESWKIANTTAYTGVVEESRLTTAYVSNARDLLECQIQLGGNRLAKVLDFALAASDETRQTSGSGSGSEVSDTTIVIVVVVIVLAIGLVFATIITRARRKQHMGELCQPLLEKATPHQQKE
eukprot:TRINITY_DN5580_c0_g1_i6.p1 TRINITY_DN5580_c0_g1~~TRINITY_DN5580_c0_g1_i6.p1  ORF type:complete len:295 (-),score=30.14 TRINITY_DN5580_c0_g1_i6:199-1083(-)